MLGLSLMNRFELLDQQGWPLQPEKCPCDIEFVTWLHINLVKNAAIMHMGTGLHHIVGMAQETQQNNNAVLGLTVSSAEMDTYTALVKSNMRIARLYQVRFGDIYFADKRLIPKFNIITAFHFGEMPDKRRQEAGGMSDPELADFLVSRLQPHGVLLLYSGSSAFDRAWPLFQSRVQYNSSHDFEHLRIIRK